jgi:hypothetical protein
MAKDFRTIHFMSSIEALSKQAADLRERCLYTSASLFIWTRALRSLRVLFVVLPIICGTLASWDLLKVQPAYATVTALLALIAGLIPAIYAALKLDDHLPTAARLAGEYKNLEIVFSDLEKVDLHKPFEDFEAAYLEARSRLEKANAEAYTAPEWCFRRAQKKIRAGHYQLGDGV